MHFVILAKPPRPHLAKTRLIPFLGAEGAARFARAALRDLLQAFAQEDSASLRRVIAWAEPPDAEDAAFAGSLGFEQLAQKDGDLGERMNDIAARLGTPIAFCGTDAPSLRRSLPEEASRWLRAGAGAVFQPALDGGYTFAAFARDPAPYFQDIPWSTGEVMAKTLALAAGFERPTLLVEPGYDVDDGPSLVAYCAHLATLRHRPEWPAETAAFLETSGLFCASRELDQHDPRGGVSPDA